MQVFFSFFPMGWPSMAKLLLLGEYFCKPAKGCQTVNHCMKFISVHSSGKTMASYLARASSLVSSIDGSQRPLSRFTLETGFFRSLSPTSTRSSRFVFVAISTEYSSLLSVSSYIYAIKLLMSSVQIWRKHAIRTLNLNSRGRRGPLPPPVFKCFSYTQESPSFISYDLWLPGF